MVPTVWIIVFAVFIGGKTVVYEFTDVPKPDNGTLAKQFKSWGDCYAELAAARDTILNLNPNVDLRAINCVSERDIRAYLL